MSYPTYTSDRDHNESTGGLALGSGERCPCGCGATPGEECDGVVSTGPGLSQQKGGPGGGGTSPAVANHRPASRLRADRSERPGLTERECRCGATFTNYHPSALRQAASDVDSHFRTCTACGEECCDECKAECWSCAALAGTLCPDCVVSTQDGPACARCSGNQMRGTA